MQQPRLVQAIEKLARAGQQAGISVEDMIQISQRWGKRGDFARLHRAESSAVPRGNWLLLPLDHVADFAQLVLRLLSFQPSTKYAVINSMLANQ